MTNTIQRVSTIIGFNILPLFAVLHCTNSIMYHVCFVINISIVPVPLEQNLLRSRASRAKMRYGEIFAFGLEIAMGDLSAAGAS